ncbi:MAG: histidine kinase [Spirochaetota bacterium]|nr:MAG: histidine kinase [Spirochaetota bacterium]
MKTRTILVKKYSSLLFGFPILIGLSVISVYNYLLFHGLAEIFSIVVAYGIFIISWNCRRNLDNDYLLFLGIAYLFVGNIDLLHTLSYKGMGVFPGNEPNLSTQLWISARYLESISLFIAPFFTKRKLIIPWVFLCYAVLIALLCLSIFRFQVFPDCFIEGAGLTPFKKMSELTISLIFAGSIAQLIYKRSSFDLSVLRLLIASITVSIGAEIAFIFYVDVYGFSNLVGHFLKIISFYLIYKALIETGLVRPFDLLYRDLKQSENELRESEIRLKKLNATKDKFFSIIAHDLRSPMSTMISIARYFMTDFSSMSVKKRLNFLKELDLIVKRTTALLDNLLNWARCQTGDIKYSPEKYHCYQIILEAIGTLESYAKNKRITLNIDVDENLYILGDRNMIATVVRNLVSNAIKYSYPDSAVMIHAGKKGSLAGIAVSDTGVGIDPENIEKLFKIDTTLTTLGTAHEKGTGLGLLLCKDFIAMNGGEIWVESGIKKGTTFYVTVPLS